MVASYYAWDPEFDCITKETDVAGAVTARYTQEPKLYGGLISQDRSGVSSFFHYDAIGTTRALTNSAQSTTDTAVYTAFGEKVASTGTAVNQFGFGAQFNCVTNHQTETIYVRARTYDVDQSKWLSFDPVEMDVSGNRNKYCDNAPTRLIDPSGLRCAKPTGVVTPVPGRGRFTTLIITAGLSANTGSPYHNGVALDFTWKPNDNAFVDPEMTYCCPCCCDDFRVIQIASNWRHLDTRPAKLKRPTMPFIWHRDDGGNPPYYPFTRMQGNPCTSTSGRVFMNYEDQPGEKYNYSWPKRVDKEFVTCIVCANAARESTYCRTERPAIHMRRNAKAKSGWDYKFGYVFVYGCIRWGWTSSMRTVSTPTGTGAEWYDYLVWVDPIGEFEFTLDANKPTSHNVRESFEGFLPPPAEWQRLVERSW